MQKSAPLPCTISCKFSLGKAAVTMKQKKHQITESMWNAYAPINAIPDAEDFSQSHELFFFFIKPERGECCSAVCGSKQTSRLLSAWRDYSGQHPERAAATPQGKATREIACFCKFTGIWVLKPNPPKLPETASSSGNWQPFQWEAGSVWSSKKQP